MRDEIRRKLKRPKRNESAVINLDSSRGPGTHWVAYKKKGNVVIYFDPFGLQPPKEVVNYFKHNMLYYSTDQVQKLNATNCGKLCLKFLKYK